MFTSKQHRYYLPPYSSSPYRPHCFVLLLMFPFSHPYSFFDFISFLLSRFSIRSDSRRWTSVYIYLHDSSLIFYYLHMCTCDNIDRRERKKIKVSMRIICNRYWDKKYEEYMIFRYFCFVVQWMKGMLEHKKNENENNKVAEG